MYAYAYMAWQIGAVHQTNIGCQRVMTDQDSSKTAAHLSGPTDEAAILFLIFNALANWEQILRYIGIISMTET